MATTWGAFSGHMRVGIDYTHPAIGSSTTSVVVSVHFYVQIDSTWNFADNQALAVAGSGSANYDYYNGLGANAILKVGQYNFNSAVSTGGGPTYTFRGTVTGHYQGASPTHVRSYTMPARPSTTPSAPGVAISSVTANSARVTITAPSNGGSAILEYQTQVDNSSAFGTPEATFNGSGTASGLAASTTYYVRSRARNANGYGPYSATKSFTTGATIPGVPNNAATGAVGESTATVSWTAPTSNGGSAIDDYTVQYATNSGFTTDLVTIPVDALTTTLTGLTPGQQYYWRVRANNGVGAGTFTGGLGFITLTGTPTIAAPTGIQTSGVFDVTVNTGVLAAGRIVTAQVSQDSSFATGVQSMNVTAPTGQVASTGGGAGQYRLRDTSKYLESGTYFVRARVTNTTTGYVTPWSPTTSFSQAHIPSASVVAPTAGQIFAYSPSTQFVFRFTDAASPNDWMTAYQLQIQNNATSEVVYDSGKAALTSSPQDNTIERNVAIGSAYKAVALRWRARVWDRGDDASAYTGWGLFTLADPPVVEILTPSDLLPVDTGSPTFAWSATFPSGGSQVAALVEVFEAETQQLVWHADVVGSGSSVTPDVVILRNEVDYYVELTVTDSTGLSSKVTRSFSTSYDAPPPFPYFIVATVADELGYVEVDWTDANPDEFFAAWKVYRRISPSAEWELLERINNQNTRTYHDYMIKAGETYSYSVTQLATRSGALLESPVGYWTVGEQQVAETRLFAVDLSHYWILNPDNADLSLRLPNVTEDSSSLEFEDATYNIIGRGRHRDYGDELGYIGSITCQARTPERPSQFKLKIEALRRSKETYYLRTPFGMLFPIAIGNLGWSPLGGVGPVEMGDMTIPYEEVR